MSAPVLPAPPAQAPPPPNSPTSRKARWKKWGLLLGAGGLVAWALLWCWQQGYFSPRGKSQTDVALALRPAKQSLPVAEDQSDAKLQRALNLAQQALQKLEHIRDYTAVFVKRERVDGQLMDEEVMLLKIRHEPFSVYLRHLEPPRLRGQEAIWVQGANQDKLIAHGAGLLGLITVRLDPENPLAMRGNRYSIREIGIKRMVQRLLELYQQHQDKLRQCQIRFFDQQLDGRECLVMEVRAPKRWPDFPWALARIYMDKQYQLPIRYEAYDWAQDAEELPLLEHYYYRDLKFNVGLTDKDFDPDNPQYNFR